MIEMLKSLTMQKVFAIALLAEGLHRWYQPRWDGVFSPQGLDISAGEGRIISAILTVGGLILWYLPARQR
jgi:hypothetical protein